MDPVECGSLGGVKKATNFEMKAKNTKEKLENARGKVF